jgi:hypothetical protein
MASAPLRVVAGSVKTTGAENAASSTYTLNAANDPRLAAIAVNRTMRKTATELGGIMEPEELRDAQRQSANQNKPPEQNNLKQRVHDAKAVVHKAKAAIASFEIIGLYVWFYPFQFLFALLFMAVYTIEKDWWLFSWFVPGNLLMGFCWLAIIFIGTIFMIKAPLIYSASGTKLFNTWVILMYFVCFAGYFAPYLFIIPWLIVWAIVVTLSQK